MLSWLKGKKKETVLRAPMSGTLVAMEAIPDHVFSARMLGDGFAVAPAEGRVVAPCRGRVTQFFPTHHALGLETPEGLEILIHVGIDTVELKGLGFTRHVAPGAAVEAGDLLLEVDLEVLRAAGKSAVTPVIITNMEKVGGLTIRPQAHLEAGSTPVAEIILK